MPGYKAGDIGRAQRQRVIADVERQIEILEMDTSVGGLNLPKSVPQVRDALRNIIRPPQTEECQSPDCVSGGEDALRSRQTSVSVIQRPRIRMSWNWLWRGRMILICVCAGAMLVYLSK
jgi:hypothetical protein